MKMIRHNDELVFNDMIAAINDEGAHVWQAEATSSNTSALPQGLTNGTNCVALDETDNIQYDRSVINGSKEDLLAAINDYTNWSGNNSTALTLSSSGFTISDAPLPIKLGYFDAMEDEGLIRLSWRTETETRNSHFIIYRNGAPIASTAGAGTTSEPSSYSYVDAAVVPGVTYTYLLADVDYANTETKYEDEAITVTLGNDVMEADFVVGTAYPNPFNPTAIVPLTLSKDAIVTASVYDLAGREVKALVNGNVSAGSHELKINGENMTTGIYLVKVVIDNTANIQKIALMK